VVRYEAVFIASSVGVLSWILAMGWPLSVWLEGKSCTFLNSYNYPIVAFISMGGGIVAIVLAVIVLVLVGQRPELEPLNGEITFEDIKAMKEGEELNKKVDDEIKGYISQMQKEREDTKMELLNYEQGIYNNNNYIGKD
jgi:hypothetical protein